MKRANHLTRLAKLRSYLKAQNLDAVLINFLPHVRYLCGYSGSSGLLFVTEKKTYFFTDFRYIEQAQKEVRGAKVIVDERNIWKNLINIKEATRPRAKIGFQSVFFSHQTHLAVRHMLPQALWIGVENMVEPIAMIKDEDEIALIQRAAAIADKGFAGVLEYIRPGVRERDVAAELEYIMKKAGSEDPAFESIVASGHRAALPHGVASKKKIANGDFVTLDFGAKVEGYVSDITRTVVVGKPTDRQKKMYKLVQRAQKSAITRMRAGATGIAVDRAARSVIERAGFGNKFGHGLGHGIGLQVHESPGLSTSSTDTLAVNMVVTVEPGVYFKGWGGVRIEDDVVVTSRGATILTQSDHALIRL